MKTPIYHAISPDLRNANLSSSQRSSLFTGMTRQPNTELEISQETFVDGKAGIQIPTGPVGWMDGNWKLCSASSAERTRTQRNHTFCSEEKPDSKIGILKINAKEIQNLINFIHFTLTEEIHTVYFFLTF